MLLGEPFPPLNSSYRPPFAPMNFAKGCKKTVVEHPEPLRSPGLKAIEILIFFDWQCKEPGAHFFAKILPPPIRRPASLETARLGKSVSCPNRDGAPCWYRLCRFGRRAATARKSLLEIRHIPSPGLNGRRESFGLVCHLVKETRRTLAFDQHVLVKSVKIEADARLGDFRAVQ